MIILIRAELNTRIKSARYVHNDLSSPINNNKKLIISNSEDNSIVNNQLEMYSGETSDSDSELSNGLKITDNRDIIQTCSNACFNKEPSLKWQKSKISIQKFKKNNDKL